MNNKNIQYYVEGEDEKKLVDVLKSRMKVIKPGKVQKLNVLQNEITDAHLRILKKDTIVVFVIDTDTADNMHILNKNIKKINNCNFVSELIIITQVPNLEGELVYCCDINRIVDLLNSKSVKDFKSEFLHITNLDDKLIEKGFKIEKLWCRNADYPYQNIKNDSDKIKIYK